MMKRISHLRSGPTFVPAEKPTEIRYKFTDDQSRAWSGLAVVEAAPDANEKFIISFKLARAT